MQILSDSTKSRVLHVREILLYDAPELKTNNYYGPEHEMYRPVKLTVKWYDDELPQTVDIDGVMEDGKDIRRSFGRGAMAIPEWIAEIAFPEPKQL